MSQELTKCDEEGVPLLVQEVWMRPLDSWFRARLFSGKIVNIHLPNNLFRYIITMPKDSQFQIVTDFAMINYEGLMKDNLHYRVSK